MTDEEAAALAAYEADIDDYADEEERSGFVAGFRAGIAHARQWRKLSADPKTWPEEGERVLLSGHGQVDLQWWFCREQEHWTHWLPLPPAPPDAKGSREVESWHLPRERAAQDGKHVVVIEEPTAPQPPESPPPADEPATHDHELRALATGKGAG